MKFNIALVPAGFPFIHFLYDSARYIMHGLESLGHDCTVAPRLDSSRLNIIMNGHVLNEMQVKSIIEPGRPYIVRQCEMIQNGINQAYQQRFETAYLPLLKHATAVWDGYPVNIEELKKHDVEAELLRIGYHPAMEEIPPKNNPDIDLLWYGSITPRRKEVLQKLTDQGFRLHMIFDDQPFWRNDLIARSKIILNIRQSDEMTQLPYGRIVYAVNNRKLVISDPCDDAEWLEKCFFMLGDVVKGSKNYLDPRLKTNLQSYAEAHYCLIKFIPMTGFLEPVLENLRGKV